MKTIVLIDRNTVSNKRVKSLLEIADYKVSVAIEGTKGLELIKTKHPDLVISETDLPELDGYSILHLMQKNKGLFTIPFIFLSERSNRDAFRKAMEMGADDFIGKPFEDSELLNAVEARLHKATLLKKLTTNEIQSSLHFNSDYQHTINKLLESSIVNHYKKKQIIFSEGNRPQYLFYLKKGKVKAFKTNDDGKDLTVGLYGEGDFIGYIGILQDDNGYNVSAQTLEDCEIHIISRSDFMYFIKNNSSLLLEFTKALAINNNYKSEQMVQLAYNSLRKRVADTLLLLKHKFTDPDDKEFLIQITREELANLSGTTTESIIRTLSDFKSEKLIEIKSSSIKILDEKKLTNMLN